MAIEFLGGMRILRRIVSTVIVTFVLVFICSFVVVGVVDIYPFVLPAGFEPMFFIHWLLCISLLGNTLFSYFQTLLSDPGSVESVSLGSVEIVGAGSLSKHTFCFSCKAAKPPSSHHCRICERCVHRMDHHCPFVANCIGVRNRRSFILFLFWVSLSAVYLLVLVGSVLWDSYDGIALHYRKVFRRLHVPELDYDTVYENLETYLKAILENLPADLPVLSVVYLLGAASGVFGMTSSMLMQQLHFVSRGETLISRMQTRQAKGRRPMAAWVNFRLVFGNGPIWTWILPRFATLAPRLNGYDVSSGAATPLRRRGLWLTSDAAEKVV